MQDIINNITDFFSGKSKVPANPDIAHNIYLLQETNKKIESGIFTRFFKMPTIRIIEIAVYIKTAILFMLALFFLGKIDNVFDTADTIKFNGQFISGSSSAGNENTGTDISWISYMILIIFLLPSVICFLLARLFTKSRKRMNTFRQVENMIARVIYNLKDGK